MATISQMTKNIRWERSITGTMAITVTTITIETALTITAIAAKMGLNTLGLTYA
jgi:hypothetical protein